MTIALERQPFPGAVATTRFSPTPAAVELFAMVWRRKGLVAVTMLAALSLAGAVLSQIPVRYDAVAEVLLDPTAPRLVAHRELTPPVDRDDISAAAEMRIILAPGVLGRAVDRLRLVEDAEFNPDVVPDESGLVARAKAVLRSIVGWTAPAVRAGPEADARDRRAEVMRTLRRALSTYQIAQSPVVAVRMRSQNAQKAALIANTIVDLYLREKLDERRASAQRSTEWLATRLDDLTRAEQAAATRAEAYRTGPGASAAFSVDEGAKLLRDLTTALAQARENGLHDRAATLDQAVSELRAELAGVSRIETKLERLESEAAAARDLRAAFQTRLAEARAETGLERSDARFVAAATPPSRPAAPNRPMILALALAGGLALGAGFAALAEGAGSAPLRAAREAEAALELPVLATAPRASVWRGRPIDQARARPGGRLAESGRELRVVFERRSRGGRAPKVVAVVSALPGEGKSTLAALLAESSARAGRRTLLIDCDLRRPAQAGIFGCEGAEDIIDVVEGEATLAQAARRHPSSGVFVLPATAAPAARSDLFASPGFRALLADARAGFDAVILDTPPVLALSDARLAAANADLAIMAVRADQTPRADAIAALRILRDAGAKLAGLVLTAAGRRADPRITLAHGGARYGRFAEYFAD